MQTGPSFSLETYREMIKPKEKPLIHLVKNRTQARICYRCDATISEFINNLIDINVDILNPV